MKKNIIGMAVAVCLLSACKSKTDSAAVSDSSAIVSAKNKQVALQSEEALVKKDVDAMLKDCSADFIEYSNGESKPMKNQDSIKINLKSFFVAFPDFKGENFKAVAHGDTVIVLGDWSGTFKGAYMGIKPTNKSFKTPDADIFTFNKDGKMTSHRSIQSDATFFSQLGISMPPKK